MGGVRILGVRRPARSLRLSWRTRGDQTAATLESVSGLASRESLPVLPVMHYNRIGKPEFRISAVGFGTCQYRLVTERQAIDTLKRGFELGVNWVHTAPDYEGADGLIARAIAESGHDVMTFSQGYGNMAHFEYLFESTCRKFHKTRLEMFG